jgi:hypothetical protein
MKRATSLFFIAFVLLALVGVALAAEMDGEVIAVDAAKGILTLKSGTVEVGFDCETGSMIKDVKVGDNNQQRMAKRYNKRHPMKRRQAHTDLPKIGRHRSACLFCFPREYIL